MSPFRHDIRIRFIDVDMTGRIHYTSLLRYFEAAEIEFFRSLNLKIEESLQAGVALPRVHVECDYLGAIHYDDLLQFEVTVGKVGHSAFRLEFNVMKEQKTVARGNFVIVAMDRASGRPVELPGQLAEPLRRYLALSKSAQG
jgi:YbgC/YbaW family acyl-CoA thioester hydrolase